MGIWGAVISRPRDFNQKQRGLVPECVTRIRARSMQQVLGAGLIIPCRRRRTVLLARVVPRSNPALADFLLSTDPGVLALPPMELPAGRTVQRYCDFRKGIKWNDFRREPGFDGFSESRTKDHDGWHNGCTR